MEDKRYTIPTEQLLSHPNIRYKKKRVNYSISEDLINDFNIYADKENLNRSAVLETFIRNFLVQVGVRKKNQI
jgi:metal-responsive CopG/Arc/MetJ family transcriptional regulator